MQETVGAAIGFDLTTLRADFAGRVVSQVDPTNFFRRNQNVAPAQR